MHGVARSQKSDRSSARDAAQHCAAPRWGRDQGQERSRRCAGCRGFARRRQGSANVLEASNRKIGPKVTTVYALRKADVPVRIVEWSPLASSLMTPDGSTTTAETG